nr:glycosyltransferase [Helleborus thibetanus]
MNRSDTPYCHVVAIPYPGRGHVNPMMNLCTLLISKCPSLTISFIISEEWLSFLSSTPKPPSINFQTIPNVIPSEHVRAANYSEFLKAVATEMEAPVEVVIDRLEVPVISALVVDTCLPWGVGVGIRRSIPVVSLWPQSPSVLWMYYHTDLIMQKGHFGVDFSERGHEVIDYIPGLSSTRLADLPSVFSGPDKQFVDVVSESFSCMRQAQCLVLTSCDELEHQVTNNIKATFQFPVFSLGPLISHPTLDSIPTANMDYFKWLNLQPKQSVLYVSLGSFMSVSMKQMVEMVQGVRESGVKYLWVTRDTWVIKEASSEMGLVVPWCDQLKVLCHSSVGGFLTHCGWNSTLESLFAGVPMITFPISFDQVPNRKLIVDDWKVGMKIKELATEKLITGKEISATVRKFMGLVRDENNEMRRNVCELREICKQASSKGGSSEAQLDVFKMEEEKGMEMKMVRAWGYFGAGHEQEITLPIWHFRSPTKLE